MYLFGLIDVLKQEASINSGILWTIVFEELVVVKTPERWQPIEANPNAKLA